MKWYLSAHAEDLRNWVNRQYPNRDKTSDGSVGDQAHATRASDHNPDPTSTPPGCVRAIDIDADLKPGAKDRSEAARLAETLRDQAKRRVRPIAYIIYNGRIASAKSLWRWRPYTGLNPHKAHIHVSFHPDSKE